MVSTGDLVASWIVIGIFAISLIYGVYYFQTENYVNDSVMNNTFVSTTSYNLSSTLSGGKSTAQNLTDTYTQDDPKLDQGNLVFLSITYIFRAISTFTIGIYNVTIGLIFNQLFGGVDSQLGLIVVGGIGIILSITIILLGWKLIRVGE